MQVVGRSAEREAILAALARAACGGGGLLVLVGVQGSGRTALLTWAAAQAGERGLEVDVVAAADAPATLEDGRARARAEATTGPARVVILDDADTTEQATALLRAIDADPH
ncbi:MAG: DUF2791 family P-loop domain-containing protein, partial [Pseudonocardia sp.]|nr:DUF2791 family P-loop domain-containing protein [Pseudonocardia sp.]